MSGQPKYALLRVIGQQPGEEGRANKYDPEHCVTIRLLAQEGKFPESWCAHLGIHLETMRNWCHRHPEFMEAVRVARVLLTDYWTERARVMATTETPKGSERVLVEILRKRFPELWGLAPPISIWVFLMEPDQPPSAAPGAQQAAPSGLNMPRTKEEIAARLEELRARRAEGDK